MGRGHLTVEPVEPEADDEPVSEIEKKLALAEREEVGEALVEGRPMAEHHSAAARPATQDKDRLKLLGERAEKSGHRLVRRGSTYRLADADGAGSIHADLDDVESRLDRMEGKRAMQITTACGIRLSDNSEAWLAAHPGATIEDFERSFPPMTSTCSTEAEAA